jgi:hypothetical protein
MFDQRNAVLLAIVVTASTAILRAQTPSASPAFDVAAIKQNKSGEENGRFGGPPGRFTATNVPVMQFIVFAYQVQRFQVEGGPEWIKTDRYDIGRGGKVGLRPQVDRTPTGDMDCGISLPPGRITFGTQPLSQLAAALSGLLQRGIVDRTGLTGTYSGSVTYTPDNAPHASRAGSSCRRRERHIALHSDPGTTGFEAGTEPWPGGRPRDRSYRTADGRLDDQVIASGIAATAVDDARRVSGFGRHPRWPLRSPKIVVFSQRGGAVCHRVGSRDGSRRKGATHPLSAILDPAPMAPGRRGVARPFVSDAARWNGRSGSSGREDS